MRIFTIGVFLIITAAAHGDTSLGEGSMPPPETRMVDAGTPITLLATAQASPAPTFQWRKDDIPIEGATSPKFDLGAVTAANTGTYTAVASNIAGATLSNAIMLVVSPRDEPILAPTITLQPLGQMVDAFTDVTFTAAATGADTTFQWQKNGIPLSGATSSRLTLRGVTSSDAASYAVVATNSAGSTGSDTVQLFVRDPAFAPTVSILPAHFIGTALTSVTFTASVTGRPAPSLEWRKNGVTVPGETGSTLTLPSLTSNDAGTYTAIATNSAGSAASNGGVIEVSEPAPPPPPPPPPVSGASLPASRLATVGPDSVTLDFVIDGTTARTILVRALGPTLAQLGVTGGVADPAFKVWQGSAMVAQNDNWRAGFWFDEAFAKVGAAPITDRTSKDAAIMVTLPPGSYSVVATSVDNASGLVLIEVYQVQ